MDLSNKAAEVYWKSIERKGNELDEAQSIIPEYEARSEVVELFLESDWNLTSREIKEEVHYAMIDEILQSDSSINNKSELVSFFDQLIKNLKTLSDFEAYIYFPSISGIPEGYEIGDLKIIEPPTEKDGLMEHMDGLEDTDGVYDSHLWGKLEYSAYNENTFIRETLFGELSIPLSILNVVFPRVDNPEDLAGAIYRNSGEVLFLTPDRKPTGWSKYVEDQWDTTLSRLSEMANKNENELTPLENNILGSIQLLTLDGKHYRNQHSFLSLMAALEGLLIHKHERPKSEKLAEKVVMLLPHFEDKVDERVDNYKQIKRWYNLRSEIIHGGYQNVHDSDIKQLRTITVRVAMRLTELSDEYYSIQKQGGPNNPHRGLNNLFVEKKLQIDLITDEE